MSANTDNLSRVILNIWGLSLKDGGQAFVAIGIMFIVKTITVFLTDLLDKIPRWYSDPESLNKVVEKEDDKEEEKYKLFDKKNFKRFFIILVIIFTGITLKHGGKHIASDETIDWLTKFTGGGSDNLSHVICSLVGYCLQASGQACLAIGILYIARAIATSLTEVIYAMPQYFNNPEKVISIDDVEVDEGESVGAIDSFKFTMKINIFRSAIIFSIIVLGIFMKRFGAFMTDEATIQWLIDLTGN